jgi:hypothetical protein
MNLAEILKGVAPTIATALGGPLAGAAASFLADKLGASDQTQATIAQVVQGVDPVKMKELDNDFQVHLAELGIQLQLAQIGVNVEEAKSLNVFVAGWRPFVGWVGGSALAYAAIIEPIARFAAQVGYGYLGAFPAIDTALTLQVLTGLLGLGVMRTVEKYQGVEGNR